MLLTGDSLGKRQNDLNSKVNDAAAKNIPFEQFDDKDDTSDVYKLFKIDLASKYKNVDYILQVLKSGDGLQITRALKCFWLYDDEHSNLINPDYLHNDVFPLMSIKMKKSLLKTISTYVRNQTRAQDFFQYCMKENFGNIAFKFLIFTTPEFKTSFIEKNGKTLESIIYDKEDIVFLIGNDFSLAELYQSVTDEAQYAYHWFILRHLYFIDPERYLRTWEIYFYSNNGTIKQSMVGRIENGCALGLRISKHIMTKHKPRIQKYIKLYTSLVNNNMLRKYTTIEEAKLYAVGLLPENPKDFWQNKFKEKYDYILNLIPDDDKYSFYRNIFKTKYPNSEFEMTKEFYDQKYYEFMSSEEKESWALCHLDNPKKSFLSNRYEDKEYLWYIFVNYDKAIAGIKRHIFIAKSSFEKEKIFNILIQTVRNEDQLLKLIQYYYETHVDESKYMTKSFIEEILDRYNVWEFNEQCWTVFNKLLHSVELYNPKQSESNYEYSRMMAAAVYYHILHEKELPETLKKFIESGSDYYYLKANCGKIKSKKQQDVIYQYLIKLFTNKITENLQTEQCTDRERNRINTYIGYIKQLQKDCNKHNEDLPEIVLKNMDFNQAPKNINRPRRGLTQSLLLQYLKQDKQSVLSQILLLKENFSKTSIDFVFENLPQQLFKINTFLRKLRIYFAHDLAKDFLKYFIASLLDDCDSKNIFAAVHGIFLLAGESFKTEFMVKNAPTDPKINPSEIDRKHLFIQEAICRFAGYSRPPVSLDMLSMYIKGDYVKYCVPLFNMYMANSVPQNCLQFVEILINAPVSVQKHGLRVAVKYLDEKNLKAVVLKIWNKSKNISLRRVMFTNLYNEMMKRKGKQQVELFKILLILMSNINNDDHKDIVNLLTGCRIPEELSGEYFETAWRTINKFPKNNKNLNRRVGLINTIASNVNAVGARVIQSIVDDYLNDIFMNKCILQNDERAKFTQLNNAKFMLTIRFIAHYDDEENITSVLPLVQYILNKCFEMWNNSYVYNEEVRYASRKFCYRFITELECEHFKLRKKNNANFNIILENITKQLLDFLPIREVYLLIWRLRVAIVTNTILDLLHQMIESQGRELVKMITKRYATEIVKIINEFVDHGNLSLTYMASISKIVKRFLDILIKPALTIRIEDAATFLADDLVSHKSTEHVLLAVHILPKQTSSNSVKEHENVINCVNVSESFEVQASYYQKMVITWSTKGILTDFSDSDSDCYN